MPRRQRAQFTKRASSLSQDELAWLHGEPTHVFFRLSKTPPFFEALWREHGDRIVDEHVEQFPGTRPERWWEFDAPRSPRGTYPGCFYDGTLSEQRERMGGIGTPQHEVLCFVPRFSFGVPVGWIDQYWAERGKGAAIDPDDPPLYESQASYLERHGLFLPGERKRLTKADWEAESIT